MDRCGVVERFDKTSPIYSRGIDIHLIAFLMGLIFPGLLRGLSIYGYICHTDKPVARRQHANPTKNEPNLELPFIGRACIDAFRRLFIRIFAGESGASSRRGRGCLRICPLQRPGHRRSRGFRRRERRENRCRRLLFLCERPRFGRLRADFRAFGLRDGPRRNPFIFLCPYRPRRHGHAALRLRPDGRGQYPPPAAGHGRHAHFGAQAGLSRRSSPNSMPNSAGIVSFPAWPPMPPRPPRATVSTD